MIALPANYSLCNSGYDTNSSSSPGASPSNQYPQGQTSPSAGTTSFSPEVATRAQKIELLRGCSQLPVFHFLLDCLSDIDMDHLAKWMKKTPYSIKIETTVFAEEWSRRNNKKESFVVISRLLQTIEQSRVANQRILLREKTGHYRFFPDYKGKGLPLVPLGKLKAARPSFGSVMKDVNGRNVVQQLNPLHSVSSPQWNLSQVRMPPPQYPFPQQQQFTASSPAPSCLLISGAGFGMQQNYYNYNMGMEYQAQMFAQQHVQQKQSTGQQTHQQQNTTLVQQHSGHQHQVDNIYEQASQTTNHADSSVVAVEQQKQKLAASAEQSMPLPVIASCSSPESAPSSSPASNSARRLPSILAEFLTPLPDSTGHFETVNGSRLSSCDVLDSEKENSPPGVPATAEVLFGLDRLSHNEPLQELHLNDWDFAIFN